MRLPLPGELNRRVRLISLSHKPVGENGLTEESREICEFWGKVEVVGGSIYFDSSAINETLTHRIYIRWVKGETRPVDLQNLIEVECESARYRVRRRTDVNDAHRFTMLECEELMNDSNY